MCSRGEYINPKGQRRPVTFLGVTSLKTRPVQPFLCRDQKRIRVAQEDLSSHLFPPTVIRKRIEGTRRQYERTNIYLEETVVQKKTAESSPGLGVEKRPKACRPSLFLLPFLFLKYTQCYVTQSYLATGGW